jgi:hypothetical protein
MSSYPGVIFSIDDFYVTSAKLAVMETTIDNYNSSLWSLVQADSVVLEWIRVIVSNRLAVNGPQWCEFFSLYNSGTYNNQWMIVDYNKFSAGSSPDSGTLYVLEQMPGLIVFDDQTNFLKIHRNWVSYNIPFYTSISELAGYPAMVEQYGDYYSYENCSRAQIFRRDHDYVTNETTMARLMRYNDYLNDPLSVCEGCDPPYSATNSISSRADLNPRNGTFPIAAEGQNPSGGADMKLTTSALITELEFIAIGGPTHEYLPPFQWSTSDFDTEVSHIGQPDLWQFSNLTVVWGVNFQHNV